MKITTQWGKKFKLAVVMNEYDRKNMKDEIDEIRGKCDVYKKYQHIRILVWKDRRKFSGLLETGVVWFSILLVVLVLFLLVSSFIPIFLIFLSFVYWKLACSERFMLLVQLYHANQINMTNDKNLWRRLARFLLCSLSVLWLGFAAGSGSAGSVISNTLMYVCTCVCWRGLMDGESTSIAGGAVWCGSMLNYNDIGSSVVCLNIDRLWMNVTCQTGLCLDMHIMSN